MIISFETDLGVITRNERLFQEMNKLVIEISDSISSYKPNTAHVEKLTLLRKEYFDKQEGNSKSNNNIGNAVDNNASNNSKTGESNNFDEYSKNNQNFKEFKSHQFNSTTATKSSKKTKKVNNVGNNTRKKEWEHEGLLAFTNSKCYDVRDSKTMFFK